MYSVQGQCKPSAIECIRIAEAPPELADESHIRRQRYGVFRNPTIPFACYSHTINMVFCTKSCNYSIFFVPLRPNIFVLDYDNNINHRTVDSTVGHDARLGVCVLYAGRDVGTIAKVAIGFCIGRDDGCLGVVVTDSCDGDGS